MRTHATQKQAIEYSQNIIRKNPIYLDTETTGLDNKAEIIELSIINYDGSVLFDSLIKPRNPIPSSATVINNINDEMVKFSPTFLDVWQEIFNILSNRSIGMYNAEFDARLIRQSIEMYGQRIPQKLRAFDIMNIFSDYRGTWDPRRNTMRRYRLEDAGKYFGIDLPNSHRALDDTKLTRVVFHRIANVPY